MSHSLILTKNFLVFNVYIAYIVIYVYIADIRKSPLRFSYIYRGWGISFLAVIFLHFCHCLAETLLAQSVSVLVD